MHSSSAMIIDRSSNNETHDSGRGNLDPSGSGSFRSCSDFGSSPTNYCPWMVDITSLGLVVLRTSSVVGDER